MGDYGTDAAGREWALQRENPIHEPVGWWVMGVRDNASKSHLPCGEYHTGSGAKSRARRDLDRHLRGECGCSR